MHKLTPSRSVHTAQPLQHLKTLSVQGQISYYTQDPTCMDMMILSTFKVLSELKLINVYQDLISVSTPMILLVTQLQLRHALP